MMFFKRLLLHSGLFYGICAAAFLAEACARQGLPANCVAASLPIAWMVQLFYGLVYWRSRKRASQDPRIQFFKQFSGAWIAILAIQILAIAALVYRYWPQELFKSAHLIVVAGIGSLAILAALAYLMPYRLAQLAPPLRAVWWLKPGIIGFCWASATVLPTLIWQRHSTTAFWGLMAENLVFVGMLAVLFDVKDAEADRRKKLTTVATKWGSQAAVFAVAGLHWLVYSVLSGLALIHVSPTIWLALQCILLATIWLCRRPQSLSFYLLWVDGQMVLKAIFGTLVALIAHK